MAREQQRPVGSHHSGRVGQVLVRDRQAVQQPRSLTPSERLVGGGRLGERLVEAAGDDRVDDAVDGRHPFDVRGDHFARRHLAVAQEASQRDRVLRAKVARRPGANPGARQGDARPPTG